MTMTLAPVTFEPSLITLSGGGWEKRTVLFNFEER